MTDTAIRFEHVSKRFRRGELFDSLRDLVPGLVEWALGRSEGELGQKEFWALNDICLDVRRGETVGIIGHNGAGKSTMLKHLAGIMQPSRGNISVQGRLSALIEVGAGFHQDLTGRENVFLNGVILGMSRAEIASKFDEIVAFSGLEDFIDTPVKRYSSGMYARLGFSVAAHLDPDILVIDEVLSVGDFVFQARSLEKMRSIARGGATLLFVSHNLKAVSDLCARSVLMEKGRIIADGLTGDVIQTYIDRERAALGKDKAGDVVIKSVSLSNANGSNASFRPGDTLRVEVAFEAQRFSRKVAVVVALLNEGLGELFHTSTEQMGHQPVDLEPGQTGKASFDLTLHLANGTFYVAAYLYRYDVQREYDRALPAATFHVSSDSDLVGPLHTYPRLNSFEVSGVRGAYSCVGSDDERAVAPSEDVSPREIGIA